MKIFDIFLGTEKEKEARQTIQTYKGAAKLSHRKKNRLFMAKKVRRWFWFRQTVIILGIISFGILSCFHENIFNIKKEIIFEQEKAKYEAGLNYVRGQVQQTDYPANSYVKVINEFTEKICWAKVDEHGSIITMSNGYMDSPWFAIITSVKHLKEHAFKIEPDKPNQLLISPTEISKAWTGIFLFHELSHLFDVYTKQENPAERNNDKYLDGEIKAYLVELELINILSKGRYQQKLAEVTRQYGLTFAGMLNLLKTRKGKYLATPENFDDIFSQLDNTIGQDKAKSDQELNLRNALHLIALSFYTADKENNNAPNYGNYKLVIIEAYNDRLF